MNRIERYVAIGDSTVEGLDDPAPGGGYRGWADRLAERIARQQGSVMYANLGVRGRTTRQVREEQLALAVAMRPDLALVVCGTNDLLRLSFDAKRLRDDVEAMQSALRGCGAMVVTFTLPDLSAIMPLARLLRARLLVMNQVIRDASAATGSIVCDLAQYAIASDPRLWSDDRLHANSEGHARIAEALAWSAGFDGAGMAWAHPLAGEHPRRPGDLVRSEIAWMRRHFLPWLWQHLRGRSSGDGIAAKRPRLMEWRAER